MLTSGGPPWTIPVGGPYEGTVNLPYVNTTSQIIGGKNILNMGDSVYVVNSKSGIMVARGVQFMKQPALELN